MAAVRTIWTRTWSQEIRGLYYINWLEKHTGRIYYDGSRVWSTTSTSGYKGSHTCNQGFGIGYSVKVTRCSTEKIGAGSLREWDYFQVHVIAHNIPIYVSHSMRAAFNGPGSIS
ncbi:hypothetical protein AX769_01690 [Frondihabitans sp. PAMC 28766]|nr:hypothetical protein AX769_01690 [Frondihabitans sp. PAMC 28766]